MSQRQLPIILALGTTQTLAWGFSYYLPAILADPIARDLGVSSNWIFAAFSASLVISALLGPRVGRQIDLVGGRSVLSISNLTLAAGLTLLGCSYSIPVLVVAWLVLGVGMGFGLYDAAFGALGRIYGDAARRAITGITLLAGFASTVGWPLTALGLETIGWRNTCFAWAAAHILLGLPLNFFMLPAVTGAKAALAGGAAASAFAIFHGTGNGILTIARGTLPLAIFGPQNYGYRLGIIGAPARMAQAAAPLAFGLLIDTMGSRVLIVSSALSLSALLALSLLKQEPAAT